MLSSKEIRQQFIDFFVNKEHKAVKSSPVVPNDDPTLLFTNAGMNQFKDIFLGKKEPSYLRAVDSQKCIRAGGKHNDLEEVGQDGYHHTFFEMLGNWSFGDYYKKESIKWAWELFTEVWKLPKDKLYATAFEDDREAHDAWLSETDIDPTHVIYDIAKHNFWEMGETGPCGPCAEIHIDMGPERCHLKDDPDHECKVNGDCHRYIELWNLVFIQYFRDKEGNLNPLKNQYIDTGAGLERVCQVLQGVESNYETDLFQPIIKAIEELSGVAYDKGDAGVNHRVIADHIRALTFAIADGGMPSNEGRGYVLRRILRRAARFGRLLNMKDTFMHKLVESVIEVMGDHYTELKEKEKFVKMIIKAEEDRFNATLDRGLQKFDEIVEKSEHYTISGKNTFLLYDTFGFPVDLTRLLAEEKNYKVDYEGFAIEMQAQRERARNAQSFKPANEQIDWNIIAKPTADNGFVGYNETKVDAKITQFYIDEKSTLRIVLDKTPFYAEQGGQVSDKGVIYNNSLEILVYNVQKEGDKFVHYGKLTKGAISDHPVVAEIDTVNRKKIARNHTATHLLHAALREVLGDHVQQKGSLVTSESLRFDFTHFQAVTREELIKAERLVNENIRKSERVRTEYKTIEEAKADGAMALFGEKYGDQVRVVTAGNFSKELCGGTHLDYVGQIGLCKVISESSISAGIRRIEAITGEQADCYVERLQNKVIEITNVLGAQEKLVVEKAQKLVEENKSLQKELKKLQDKMAGSFLDDMIKNAIEINGIKVIAAIVDESQAKNLRQIGMQLTDKIGSGIGVLGVSAKGKVNLLAAVTKDLTKKIQAGKIVNEVAQIVGGKGGGKPELAMAGGKDPQKLTEAISAVNSIIESLLK